MKVACSQGIMFRANIEDVANITLETDAGIFAIIERGHGMVTISTAGRLIVRPSAGNMIEIESPDDKPA